MASCSACGLILPHRHRCAKLPSATAASSPIESPRRPNSCSGPRTRIMRAPPPASTPTGRVVTASNTDHAGVARQSSRAPVFSRSDSLDGCGKMERLRRTGAHISASSCCNSASTTQLLWQAGEDHPHFTPVNTPAPGEQQDAFQKLSREIGLRHHTFPSDAFATEVGYCIYLPPGYSDAADAPRLPVIYNFHGAGQNEFHSFPDVLNLHQVRTIAPYRCSVPRAPSGQEFLCNGGSAMASGHRRRSLASRDHGAA
jgi:hypothetical protein